MSIQQITRGNVATLAVTFFGVDGNPMTPGAASMTFVYSTSAGKQRTTLAMAPPAAPEAGTPLDTALPTAWTVSFDTTPVIPGRVFYYAASTGPASAGAGSFEVTSNPAGPTA